MAPRWRASRSPETRRSALPANANNSSAAANSTGTNTNTNTNTSTNSATVYLNANALSDYTFPSYNCYASAAAAPEMPPSDGLRAEEAEGLSRALSRALAAEQARERRRAQGTLASHTASELERAIAQQRAIERQIERDRRGYAAWSTSPALVGFDEDRRREMHRQHAEAWRARREGRPIPHPHTSYVPNHLLRSTPGTPGSLSGMATPPPPYTVAMLDRAPAYPFPCAPYNPYEDQGLGAGFGLPEHFGPAIGPVRPPAGPERAPEHGSGAGRGQDRGQDRAPGSEQGRGAGAEQGPRPAEDVDLVEMDLDVVSAVGSSVSSSVSSGTPSGTSASSSSSSRSGGDMPNPAHLGPAAAAAAAPTTNPTATPTFHSNPASNLASNLPPTLGFTGARPAPLPGRRAPVLRRDESWSQPWTVSAAGVPLGVYDLPPNLRFENGPQNGPQNGRNAHNAHNTQRTHSVPTIGPEHSRDASPPGGGKKRRAPWMWKRDKEKEKEPPHADRSSATRHRRNGTVGSMIETVLAAAI